MKYTLHKTFDATINSRSTLLDAVREFGLNLCKGTSALKKDKTLVLEAIKSDPFCVSYLDETMQKDDGVKQAVLAKKNYLSKYVDPLSETIKINADGSISNEDIKKITIRNQRFYEAENQVKLSQSER